MASIVSSQLVIGLEVHVQLATRTKVFSSAPSPAVFPPPPPAPGTAHQSGGPNTCVDPLVLGLPGSLPVVNRAAIELSMRVGLALGCEIAAVTRWDRKSYFYPDMPKNYQLSQYDMPLCGPGLVELDPDSECPRASRIRIRRAHLEEDAGKLLHEAPGGGAGGAIDFSIIDLDRAGCALLEIVTEPDFSSSDEVVRFCRWLRAVCVHLGASRGVLQEGHVRFEPNINTVLRLDDGREVRTPIVEVKNLNSYKAVKGAIDFEARDQPARWLRDGRVMGPGTKTTRGWDESRGKSGETFVQREKEDAHDYRYFPDPDLLPVKIEREWVERVRAAMPELPAACAARLEKQLALPASDARAIAHEPGAARFFEEALAHAGALAEGAGPAGRGGEARERLPKTLANLLLQSGAKLANARGSRADDGGDERGERDDDGERGGGGERPALCELGISAAQLGTLGWLRASGRINSNSADELFALLCDGSGRDALELAEARGMIVVRDEGALEGWVEAAIRENARAADDVRAGKDQALGRLVGAAMKLAAGKGDASEIRRRLLEKLGRG